MSYPPDAEVSATFRTIDAIETLPILPDDLPPTLDADGLRVRYLVRAVVDIAFRPDADVERLIVVT